MRIRNFFWDFDGMLFDTYPHTQAVFLEMLRRRGRTADPDELYQKMKITLWDAFRFYGADDAFIRDFYELENTLDFEPVGRPFDGIPAVLRAVTAGGGRNYLYTHRDRVAYEYLDRWDLTPLFAGGVTAEDGFPLKPAPDALDHLIVTHGLRREESMMLGDRLIDIGAGRNAGVHTCLFDPDGALPVDRSDFACRDTAALLRIVTACLAPESEKSEKISD